MLFGVLALRAHSESWTLTGAPVTNWTSLACSADGHQIVGAAGGAPYVVESGPIYISRDSGLTWTASTAPGIGWAAVASSSDGSMLIAAGSQGGSGTPIYISMNSGNSWLPNPQAPSPFGWWNGLACSSDGNIVLAGSGGIGGEAYGGQISISTNAGTTWDSTSSSGYLTCVACSGGGGTMMVGLDAANPAPMAISTNSGASWFSVPVGAAYSVACSADGTRMIANNGRNNPFKPVYTSLDSGTTWTQATNSGVEGVVVAISADGRTMMTAVSAAYLPNGESPIFVSHDSGATWTSNSFQNLTWASLACSADGSTLVAAASGGGIYRSRTTPAPVLSASTLGTNLLLSWIVPSMAFVLQQSPDLTSGTWKAVGSKPVLNYSNSQYQVAIPNTQGMMFYRLASQ